MIDRTKKLYARFYEIAGWERTRPACGWLGVEEGTDRRFLRLLAEEYQTTGTGMNVEKPFVQFTFGTVLFERLRS
jgi:hypothetical protein